MVSILYPIMLEIPINIRRGFYRAKSYKREEATQVLGRLGHWRNEDAATIQHRRAGITSGTYAKSYCCDAKLSLKAVSLRRQVAWGCILF